MLLKSAKQFWENDMHQNKRAGDAGPFGSSMEVVR